MEPVRVYGTRQEVSRIQAAYALLSDKARELYARLPYFDRTAEVAWNLVKAEQRAAAIPRPSGFQSIGQIFGPRDNLSTRVQEFFEASASDFQHSSPDYLKK